MLLIPVLLLAICVLLVYVPPVQDLFRSRAVNYLAGRTGTTVRLARLRLTFPLDLRLEGLFVADEQGDTLVHAERLRTSVELLPLLDGRLRLTTVDLTGIRANLRQRADSTFNFDFIIRAFAAKDPDTQQAPVDSGGGLQFDLKSVHLERIHFDMDMVPSELAMQLRLGQLDVSLDTFALAPLRIHVDAIAMRNTSVDLRTTKGVPEPATYPALTNPLSKIDVRFNAINVEAVRFSLTTIDTGDSLWVSVLRGALEASAMDASQQRLALSNADLVGLRIGTVSTSKERSKDTVMIAPPWLDQHDGFRFWTQDWDLAIEHLRVANSGLAFHTDSISTPSLLLDPAHLVYTGIGLNAREVQVNNGHIALKLDSLSLQGGPKGEHVVLAVQLDATPSAVSLDNGRISALGNTLAFHASAKPGDLSIAYRSPEAVPLDAEVGGDLRLAELLPMLHKLGVELPEQIHTNETWRTKAWFTGSLQTVESAGIHLDGDQGSRIHANGSIINPTKWPNSTYAITVEDLTIGAGLHQVTKAYVPANVPFPVRLSVHGKVNGSAGTVRAAWDLDSDLGNVSGTAAASQLKGMLPNTFDVDITATGILAARLTGDTALGPVSFSLIGQGDGLHGATRKGSFTLTPTLLSYRGKDLSSLRMKADAAGDTVRVEVSSEAEDAALRMVARGPWPTGADSLAMQLDLAIERLYLEELGVTRHMLHTEGHITGNLTLRPDLRGRVDLETKGLRLFNNENAFDFERFTVHGLLDTDTTAMEIDSDVAHVAYHSNLALDSALHLMNERVLSAFQEPYDFRAPPGKHMDLKVDLPGTDRLARLILPELKGMEVQRFEGHYNGDTDALELHLDVPLVDYSGVMVKGLVLELDAERADLKGHLEVLRVTRDSLRLDDLVLEATNAPGALNTLLRLRDGEEDRYRIGLDLHRKDKVPMVHLQEDLVLDRRPWQAQPGNALYMDPKGLRAVDMILSSDSQRVELRTAADGNHLDISNFKLSTIMGLVHTQDSLAMVRGTLDASVLLPLHVNERLEADVLLNGLEVMDVAIGSVKGRVQEGTKDNYQGTLDLDAGVNQVHAEATADLTPGTTRIAVDSDIDLKDLAMLKPFVTDYLFDLGGALNGQVRYTKEGDHISIVGRPSLTDGRIGLIQTGSVYLIPNDTVIFDHQGLTLNDFTVMDAAGNRFRLDGHVLTGGSSPRLDLQLRTDRFQLVNSTAKDNPTFYGKLFGSIDLHIGGTAFTPTVQGNVGILDSTDLSVVLPGSKVDLVEHEGIVQFTTDFDAQDTLALKTDSEMLRDSLAAQLPGIDLDLQLKLDPDARFAVVIDPTTGDQATFRGSADLTFRYNPDGDIYLQGPFTVVDGGYTVEFYGLVKKRFDLVPGGTIIWDGDPLAGRMDIQAKYSTTAAPYPLVSNARGGLTESERNTLQARLPFDVLINIRESVKVPAITFGLDMDRQVRNSYPQVNSVLDQLTKASNKEELNRQVFGLLVLSTFIENETGSDPGGSSLASTAARNSVNGILTQQLNRLTGQGIKGMDIQLGVNTYDQTEAGQSYSRTTVDYKVTQRILNDRVSIEAGGSMGYNERKQEVSGVSNTKAPQYGIAYDITEDGRLRLRLYHENAYDLYDGELVNNGVAIMLTRDFEKDRKTRERLRKEIIERRRAEPTKEDAE